ncbi:retropepsin-like aspartic protease family protein [Sphingomonas alba]|uniref:TIGR02281 family clan AA aspartic protease n=1 Tax=Sphingomonas alba TaxID=2908208 RepID=A0ABT0RKJ1_9SPHN|nr:TIGR02281 family clan AA aspartic protease [Sphingomonas alba]MCL6683154.1 TIGR02281 family clan AA aspartic protease [Sphingomonas alba]
MVRAVLIFLLLVGLGASLLNTAQKPELGSSANSRQVIAVDHAANSSEALSSLDTGSAAGDAVTLQRQPDGHFYADPEINGARVHMLIDTGATAIALTRDDARKAGIGISIGMPNVIGQGAGGDVRGEYVTVDRIKLGEKTAEAMNAVVLDGGGVSLLGQTFLSKFASVEIHGDTMVLR